MLKRLAALALLAAPACASAEAQDAPRPFAIPNTAVLAPPRAANGIDYELYVRASPACSPERRCTAVYMLDAEYSFGLASLIAEHLEDRGQLEPLVLVAIAYADKSQYRYNRSRDYTPTHTLEGGYGAQMQRDSGGGPMFLDVIRREIIPHIEGLYPVDPARRGIIGHSYGGLFSTYAFLSAPDLFTDAIAVSPSYWYDERMIFQTEAGAPERAVPGRIYIGVGSYEEQGPPNYLMVSLARDMADSLDGRADIEHAFKVYEHETHASIFPTVLSDGLRALFHPEH